MTTLSTRQWALVLFTLVPSYSLCGQSVHDLTLNDVLLAALERAAPAGGRDASPLYRSSAWLAAFPSVSVGYLQSDARDGTDETELSINLPLQSRQRRRADKTLAALADEFESTRDRQRRLYVSGLIREAVWSHRIAAAQGEFAGRKVQLLEQLEQQYTALFAASATPEYTLLLIRKERVVAEIKQEEYRHQALRWLQQYRQITGLGNTPAQISEPGLQAGNFSPDQHPDMRLVTLDWLQQQQLLIAAQAAPWQLSLTAKNLETNGFEEDQIGVALEVPLTFIKVATQSHNSQWQQQKRQHGVAQDALRLQLKNRWEALLNTARLLQRKQQLLARSSQLSERIAQQTAGLKAHNEIGAEIMLRHTIESIDTQGEVSINQILIDQNTAMLRQAAGISL